MARYIVDFETSKPDDMIRYITEDFFSKEGFTLVDFKGEVVWKKGTGLMTAPQFVKVSSLSGRVHLEAWMKNAILPGVYVGEMGLDGAYGWAVKKVLKDRVNTLTALLLQGAPTAAAVPAPVMAGPPAPGAVSFDAAGEMPVPAGPVEAISYADGTGIYPTAPVPVAVHDPKGKAVASLILGLVSVIGCIWPFAGIVTAILGIITGLTGRKSTAKTMATAGLVISIVFLIVSVVDYVFYFLLLLS